MPNKNWKRRLAIEYLIVIILVLADALGVGIVFSVRSNIYQKEKSLFLEKYNSAKQEGFDPSLFLAEKDLEAGKSLNQLSSDQIDALTKKKNREKEKEKFEDYSSDTWKPDLESYLLTAVVIIPLAWVILLLIRITLWSIRTVKKPTESKK